MKQIRGGVPALSGVALVVVIGIAAPWWGRDGYGVAAAALLLVAAGLIVFALRRRVVQPATDADIPAAPLQRRAFDDDLRDQLQALRTAQSDSLQAKQTSEAAMLAKDEFLATVSHEIRTPLNGVLPLLELVLSTPLTTDQRDHLDTAYRSAQEMLSIVDDILDYSKLDVGKLELERIGVNVRELVDAVAQLMRRSAESKGLRLSVHIGADVRLAVRGDPVRLRQVLSNLVGNAIKFTERGEVSITVSRHGETPTHHEIMFAVRDTGIGITAQAAAKLFQPFAQGDASITRAFGGTGLGLVICKRLVDLMGGRLGVQSEPHHGSLFWFSVPLAKVVGDLPAQADLHAARALLVGGDDAFTRRLRGALATFGMRTTAATESADALAKLRTIQPTDARSRYALLTIDGALGAACAATLVRNVLKDAAFAQTRILVFGATASLLQGSADPSRMERLPRSFDESQLRAALDRLFGGAASEPPPAESAHGSVGFAQPDVPMRAPRPFRARVLLVEDNLVNLKVAQRLLELHGLDVEVVGNGSEALDRLRETRYDLVLMDCQMPVMDGYTATRSWRNIERERALAATPIIAMTANAMMGDRAKCLASGMDDYLSKPLSRMKLEELLQRWLEHTSPREIGMAPEPVPETAQAAPTTVDLIAPESQASAHGSVLDNDIVSELRTVMGSEFALLVRVYLNEAPSRIAALEQAASCGDKAAMIAQTHPLKSSSANLGAIGLAQLAGNLEESLRCGSPIPLRERVDLIGNEYQRVAESLHALLAH